MVTHEIVEEPSIDDEDDEDREPCPECGDGDKVPAKGYWRCPVCDAEWLGDEDEEPL